MSRGEWQTTLGKSMRNEKRKGKGEEEKEEEHEGEEESGLMKVAGCGGEQEQESA